MRAPGFEAQAALDPSRPVVVHCRSGARTEHAAGRLAALGFPDLANAGGFQALADAGLPTEPMTDRLHVPAEAHPRLGEALSSDQSPVGIDVTKPRVVVLDLRDRLARLEARLGSSVLACPPEIGGRRPASYAAGVALHGPTRGRGCEGRRAASLPRLGVAGGARAAWTTGL